MVTTAHSDDSLVVRVTPTETDHRYALRRALNSQILALRVIGPLVMLVGLLALLADEPVMTIVGLGIAVIGLALVGRSFTLVGLLIRRLPRTAYAEQTDLIGADGVRQEGAHTALEWKWDGFRDARRTAHLWVLAGGPGERPAVLLRRAFSTAEEQRLTEILAARQLLPS